MENAPNIFDKMPEFSRIGSFSFLFWAILIGLFLSVVVNMGPAFITLVQTSLHRGARSAAWFAIGVILNDAMIVSLCILTSVQVVMHSPFEAALACIGAGVILLLFGFFTYRRKVKGREKIIEQRTKEIMKERSDKPSWFVFLGKGFVLNILNPFRLDFLVFGCCHGGWQHGRQQVEHPRVFCHHSRHHTFRRAVEGMGSSQAKALPQPRTHRNHEQGRRSVAYALRRLLHCI